MLTAAGGGVLVLGGVLTAVLGTSSAGPTLIVCTPVCAVLCVVGGIRGVRAIRPCRHTLICRTPAPG
jgi:hypothetical protein